VRLGEIVVVGRWSLVVGRWSLVVGRRLVVGGLWVVLGWSRSPCWYKLWSVVAGLVLIVVVGEAG
jgi:hypothetical protein